MIVNVSWIVSRYLWWSFIWSQVPQEIGLLMERSLAAFHPRMRPSTAEWHLLITLSGLIIDFELAPANAADLKVGAEILSNHTHLTVIGDKGYIDAQTAAELFRQNQISLLTLPRRNHKKQFPYAFKRYLNSDRQMIETFNNQLADQFNIEQTTGIVSGAFQPGCIPN